MEENFLKREKETRRERTAILFLSRRERKMERRAKARENGKRERRGGGTKNLFEEEERERGKEWQFFLLLFLVFETLDLNVFFLKILTCLFLFVCLGFFFGCLG